MERGEQLFLAASLELELEAEQEAISKINDQRK